MDNVTIDESCGRVCPHECNTISYTFSLVSTPLDPLKMCPKNMRSKDFLMKEFYKTDVHSKYPPMFMRKLSEILQNVSSADDVICKRNINYRAEVIFRLATNSISVTVISRRLSFFDKLSAFGNYKILLCSIIFCLDLYNFSTLYLEEAFLACSQV